MSVDNILEQLESIDQKLHQSSLNLDSIELQLQQQTMNNNTSSISIVSNTNNDVSNAVSIEWPAARIRSTFIDFFVHKKNHVMWPSSPVVPVNDPTLLFANAGDGDDDDDLHDDGWRVVMMYRPLNILLRFALHQKLESSIQM